MGLVTVIVQTCPQRRDVVGETLESLFSSDAAGSVVVMEHPDGVERCRFFRSVLERMANAPTPFVIRCEDDIIVNRHIVHNFVTWPALHHPLFGCGWLYVSEMTMRHHTTLRLGSGLLVRGERTMYGSLCVGMSRQLAQVCLDLWDAKAERYGCPLSMCAPDRRCVHASAPMEHPHQHGQDTLISQAIWDSGRRVFFHAPALAENRMLDSVRGTTYPPNPELHRHLSAGPYFDPEWKRLS